MPRELKHLSIDDMIKEIKRREKLISRLNRRRTALLKQLSSVELEIKKAGGDVTSFASGPKSLGAGSRHQNKQSLADTMASVMSKEKSMSVAEIEKAVVKRGYRSTSVTFKTIIFQTLGKNKRFKKAARGQYLLK